MSQVSDVAEESAVADPATESDVEPQPAGDVVIGVRIREASRIYHVAAPHGSVFVGEYVVIDRGRGDQLARVVTVPDDEAPASRVPSDVRPIVRLADAADRDQARDQAERADVILHDFRVASTRDGLGIYPVAVELNLTGDRGTVWFQAPDHVDFRSLLNQIQDQHQVDLKMQQANQRERAQLVDGYDICGLRLCCSSWMTEFPHVGIRVAKDQDLSLNPDSISGVCGRLLCCLTFEHEVYREMRGSLPRVGKRVTTPAGMGRVVKLNVLKQMVTISLDDHPQRVDVPADEIGLAVRTEDAPNQALADAQQAERREREAAQALRQAAAPTSSAAETPAAPNKRRRRRRPRGEASQAQTAAPTQQSPQPAPQPSEAAPRPKRRRRRRKANVVNQPDQAGPTGAPPPVQQPASAPASADGSSEAPRPKRRRRRGKRPAGDQGQPQSSD